MEHRDGSLRQYAMFKLDLVAPARARTIWNHVPAKFWFRVVSVGNLYLLAIVFLTCFIADAKFFRLFVFSVFRLEFWREF